MKKAKTTNIYVDNHKIQIQKKHRFLSYFKSYILIFLLLVLLLCIVTSAFIIDYKMVLMLLGNYIPVTATIIYAVIVIFFNVKWLRNHLYIPLTHDELSNNHIESCEQYRKVIFVMFYYKPLKKAIQEIENTAREEFKTEIDIWDYYQEGRLSQIFPIVYIILFACVFVFSLFSPCYDDCINLQWAMMFFYIFFSLFKELLFSES